MPSAIDKNTESTLLNGNPFDLQDDVAYQKWRSIKLQAYPLTIETLKVSIADVEAVTDDELEQLRKIIHQHNLVIYDLGNKRLVSKADVRRFARKLGLDNIDNNICSDEDSITTLQVSDAGQKKVYIPYTNRRLSWHSDGYYNTLDKQIRGMLLHCVSPAAEGGSNMLLDHEMLYIQLRDANPAYITALMHAEVMTIPPNNESENGEEIRPAQSGPVFSLEKGTNNLHMRYSARTRNIIWGDDAITAEAVAKISDFLENSPYILRYMLQAGQGVICNNVLHNRTSFEDSNSQHRLLYRARFYDRVEETSVTGIMNQVN